MSIINNQNNFIFIHVPKSAGTSVATYLSSISTCRDIEIGATSFGELIQPHYEKKFGLDKHSTIDEIIKLLGCDTVNSFFTFGFCRDPYERTISIYNFLRQWDGWFKYYTGNEFINYKYFLENVSLNEFIKSDFFSKSDGIDRLFKPQAFWLGGNAEDMSNKVSYVGRVENMEESTNYIRNKIGSSGLTNSISWHHAALNMDKNIVNIKNISRACLDVINEKYSIDFKLYEYRIK